MFVTRNQLLQDLFVVLVGCLSSLSVYKTRAFIPIITVVFAKPQLHHYNEGDRRQRNFAMVASDTNPDPTKISQGKQKECHLRLYLVRHGESEANQRGIFAGQLDSPLTEPGIDDATSLGERSILLPPLSRSQTKGREESQPCPFDRVYSSDLVRAHDTCKLMLEGVRKRGHGNHINGADKDDGTTATDRASGLWDARLDQRLRERSYGTLEGMPWSSDRSETDKIWRDTHAKDKLPPKWESDDDIWIRVKSFLSELIEEESLSLGTTRTTQQMETTGVDATAASIDNKSNCDDNDDVATGVDHDRKPTRDTTIHPKQILIASHGGVLRQILLRLVGLDKLREMGATFDAKRKNKLITPNTSLTILDLSIRPKQHHATCSMKNQAKNVCTVDGESNKEDEDFDHLKGVLVEIIVFANTDHLVGEIQIHDD